MCDACGCAALSHHQHDHHHHDHADDHHHGTMVVSPQSSLLAANDALARANREHFDDCGLVAINLISSPGSGKTTLLEHTIDALGSELRIGVIEGDIETERDAERIRAKKVPVVQLTTGGACHLDAAMTHRGFHLLEKEKNYQGLDILFIENVGNLVCPATFDLGEHHRIVLVSVPEGPDKPAKYPKAFVSSQLFLITKTDLLPYFDFPLDEARTAALQHNPQLQVLELSATSGNGMAAWLEYLRGLVTRPAAVR